METKQLVAALETGSLEDHNTVEVMADAARLIIAQQARIEQLTQAANQLVFQSEEYDFDDGLGRGARQEFWDDMQSVLGTQDDLTAIRAHDEKLLAINSQAAKDVLAERQRQQTVEGWTPEHDDTHKEGSMALAAACYAMAGAKLNDRAAAREKFNGNDGDTGKTHKLICPRCGVDRLNVPCPEPLHLCPVKGKAQSAAIEKGGAA